MDTQVFGWSLVGATLSALRMPTVELSKGKEMCKSKNRQEYM